MAFAIRKIWVASVCAGLLLGCVAQPATVSQHETISPSVKAPETAEGAAEIYVFNISGWTLIPSNQDVTDNGKPLASLPRLTYKKAYIAPGAHDLQLHGRKLILDAERGGRYFVVVGYRPERSWAFPLAGDPVVIKQVTEEEARPLMQDLTPH